MTATALKQVSDKLKNLPDNLIEDVENYIDFLAYKQLQEKSTIPEWHKKEVLKRIELKKTAVDAFDMIENLEE